MPLHSNLILRAACCVLWVVRQEIVEEEEDEDRALGGRKGRHGVRGRGMGGRGGNIYYGRK